MTDFTLFTERTSNTHTHTHTKPRSTSHFSDNIGYLGIFLCSQSGCFFMEYFSFICDYTGEKQHQYCHNELTRLSNFHVFFSSVTFPSWKSVMYLSLFLEYSQIFPVRKNVYTYIYYIYICVCVCIYICLYYKDIFYFIYSISVLGNVEYLVLTVMAHDCYVANCNFP